MNLPPQSREGAPPSKEWQTGSLRITAFCLSPPDLNAVRWWESLTGQSAESRNVRIGLGELIEQGPLEDRVLQLQIHLGRIDWLLLPKDEPESAVFFPPLGDFAESSKTFHALMSKWLIVSSPVNRLAFGAQLFIPSSGRGEAMQHIARMLPCVRINWEGIQDFIFQVNRPAPCLTLPEVGSINRLAKWAAVARTKLLGTLLPEVQAVPVVQDVAAFLELDINTAPPTDIKKELPTEKLSELLRELIDNARVIAAKGYAE